MISHNNKKNLWNCRGAASPAFYRSCKQYLDTHKPEVVVVMETRVDPNKLAKTFKLLGFDNMQHTECRGYAGGIIVAWKSSDVQISVESADFQFMHLKIAFMNGTSWEFTAVYASPKEDLRQEMWTKLKLMSHTIAGGWMMAGDFNDIATQDEKK
jgi:exonuclease III